MEISSDRTAEERSNQDKVDEEVRNINIADMSSQASFHIKKLFAEIA